jgi:hypothetical protein
LRQRALSRNHLTTPGSWRQASSRRFRRFFFPPSVLIVEEASYLRLAQADFASPH